MLVMRLSFPALLLAAAARVNMHWVKLTCSTKWYLVHCVILRLSIGRGGGIERITSSLRSIASWWYSGRSWWVLWLLEGSLICCCRWPLLTSLLFLLIVLDLLLQHGICVLLRHHLEAKFLLSSQSFFLNAQSLHYPKTPKPLMFQR